MATVDKIKFGKMQIFLIVSITFGLLVVLFFKLYPNTYAVFLTVAIMAPFMMLIVGSGKRFLLATLTMCLPITVDITIGDTGHIGGTSGYVISAFDIVLAGLYLFWLSEMIWKKNISINFFPHISIPALFLIGTATLSMAFAPYPYLSMFEIIEVIKMYLCFLYLANNIKSKSDVQFVIAFLLSGLLFEGLLGFAQHHYGEPFWPRALGGPWSIVGSRVTGTWESFNDFAWYLPFIIPIALSMCFSEIKLIYKFLCGFTFFLSSGSLVWSDSRGGWISFLIAALFVIISVFSKIKGKTDLIKTFATIMAIIILLSPLYPKLSAKFYVRLTADDRGSAESRLPQYKVAWNIIKNNPLVGIGINNYTELMSDYDITEEGLESITHQAVHNIFLQIIAEMGIFGIAIFIWFIAAIFIEGIEYIISNRGSMVYAVIGMVAGIMAFLVHGLVDTASIGSKMYMFVWFFAGIICAIKKIKPVATFFP